MTTNEGTILEIQVELQNLMDDFESRILKVYDKYTDSSKSIPKLPKYDSLNNQIVRYNLSVNLTNCIDELSEMKLRAGMLYRSFSQYSNFQPPTKTEYVVVQKFKSSLKSYMDSLDQYRFELTDLIKNANNKLRVIDSVQFFDM